MIDFEYGLHWIALKYPWGSIDLLDSNREPAASYGRQETRGEWTYRGGTEEQIAQQMALVEDYRESQIRRMMAS